MLVLRLFQCVVQTSLELPFPCLSLLGAGVKVCTAAAAQPIRKKALWPDSLPQNPSAQEAGAGGSLHVPGRLKHGTLKLNSDLTQSSGAELGHNMSPSSKMSALIQLGGRLGSESVVPEGGP